MVNAVLGHIPQLSILGFLNSFFILNCQLTIFHHYTGDGDLANKKICKHIGFDMLKIIISHILYRRISWNSQLNNLTVPYIICSVRNKFLLSFSSDENCLLRIDILPLGAKCTPFENLYTTLDIYTIHGK